MLCVLSFARSHLCALACLLLRLPALSYDALSLICVLSCVGPLKCVLTPVLSFHAFAVLCLRSRRDVNVCALGAEVGY